MFENESPVSNEVEKEEDYDALYDSIQNGESGEQFTDEKVEAAPAPEPVVEQKEPEYEYEWSGQKIKAPLSQLLKKASMGHDYAQKMAEFNKQRESFTQERRFSEQLKEQYGAVDEWVKGNPDKWEKLQAVIEAEKAGHGDLDVNNPLFKELQDLKRQLNESIMPTIQSITEEKTRIQHDAEDKALESEIKSIREKYKDLDWSTVDENGRSREMKVLQHASQHGFKTFKSAFFDLYHDDIEKRANEQGRISVQNDKAKQIKTGLLGTSQAPKANLSKATNTKNKSYNELTREALEELGIR